MYLCKAFHVYSRWVKAIVIGGKCWTVVFLHNKSSWHFNISAHLWRLTGLESAGAGGVTVWIESGQGIVTQQERALALEAKSATSLFFLYQSSRCVKKNYLEPQRWCWRQLGDAAKLSAGMCQAEGWNLNPSPIIPTSASRSTSQWTKWETPAQFGRIAVVFFDDIFKSKAMKQYARQNHQDIVVDTAWFIAASVFQDQSTPIVSRKRRIDFSSPCMLCWIFSCNGKTQV